MSTAIEHEHPPRPRLALNVGVTGHRPNRLNPDESDALCAAIAEALATVEQGFQHIAASAEAGQAYDLPKPKPKPRLLSPLAEGADRIAAELALAAGYELQCPLPFPRDIYAEDFPNTQPEFDELLAQASRVVELDGDHQNQRTQEQAYLAVGLFMLRHADILLAVWDGVEDKYSVGTAGIVAHAESHQIPTIRVLTTEAPYKVEFRDAELTGNEWMALDKALARLDERLRRILLPPDLLAQPDTPHDKAHPTESIRAAYYQHGDPDLDWVAKSYRLFFGVFGKHTVWGLFGSYLSGARAQWKVVEQAGQKLPSSQAELSGSIHEPFLWADRLATFYADKYRGTYSLMFSLAAFAVLLALLSGPFGVFKIWPGGIYAEWMPWLAIAELGAIVLILYLWRRSHHGQFHEKWLDFRLLAELLRQRAFLLPIGGIISLDLPDHEADNDRSFGWVKWLARAVSHADGLPEVPTGGFNSDYRRGYAQYLADLLHNQAEYHQKNAERNGNITDTIHFFDSLLMVSIFLACIIHIIDHVALHYYGLADWTVIAAAVLPAFGATAHAVFSHGEFKRIAERSGCMARRLKDIAEKLAPADGTVLPTAKLDHLADRAVDAMGHELSDWRMIFRSKPLEPAL